MYGDLDLTDKYLVSNTGKIYSKKSNRVLKTCIHKTGYETVCISLGSRNTRKLLRVHMAVAFMFVDGYEDGLQVNHIDGNKLNNDSTNLEWVTASANVKHAFEIGLNAPVNKKMVKQIDAKTDEVIGIFNSLSEAARSLGYNTPANISEVLNGRHQTAYGYKWAYA